MSREETNCYYSDLQTFLVTERSEKAPKKPKNALGILERYFLGSLAEPSVLATLPTRFELVTSCLEGSCSIQLS